MVRLISYMCIALFASHVEGFAPQSRQTSLKTRKDFTEKRITHPLHKVRGGKLFSWPLTRDPKGVTDYPLAASRIGITVLSTYLTWYAQAQYSNVMASAAVTLICSMVFDKRLGQAAFCGTFAGMCSKAIIPTSELALSLGIVTSFLFEVLIHYQNVFLGIGGRLGMTAFLATSVVAAATGVSTGFRVSSISINKIKKSTILPMALWHAIGSVATIVLREASDDSSAADPVRASAVIGLTGALLLENKTAALAVYGGSFVGAIGGVIHGATINWNMWSGGWGGKAGTCAFIGCLLYRLLSKIINSLVGR